MTFCAQQVYPAEISAPAAYLCYYRGTYRLWTLEHLATCDGASVVTSDDRDDFDQLVGGIALTHRHWNLTVVEAPSEVIAANAPKIALLPASGSIEVPAEDVEVVVRESSKKKKRPKG